MLVDLLTARTLAQFERSKLANLLATPWCWPLDPELATFARAQGFVEPRAPRPGETCILSIENTSARLWQLFPAAEGLQAGVRRVYRLEGSARASASLAWRIAVRDLPIIRATTPLERPPEWGAFALAKIGDGLRPSFLDGESFGLALCLATASALLDEPVPPTLMALATFSASGALGKVGALKKKLEVVSRWALGVDRVLVSSQQRDEAEAARKELSWPGQIVPVGRLSDAIDVVFPGIAALVAARWDDEAAATRCLECLYDLALHGHPSLLGWRAIGKTAHALADFLARDAEAVRKAHFAEHVSLRHESEPVELGWPTEEWLAETPRPERLDTIAHIVQAAADAGAESLAETVDRARNHVAAPFERHAEDLKVLGALGWALAALGRENEAVELLREALKGWKRIRRLHEASFALSEYVRLLGHLRRAEPLLEVLANEVTAFANDPQRIEKDFCYVTLSAGRALACVGQGPRAIERLAVCAAPWDMAPAHVDISRRRWLARAFASVADTTAALRERDALEALCGAQDPPDPNLYLARIDAALEAADDPLPPLKALLESSEGGLFRLLLVGRGVDRPGAEHVATAYRY